MDIGEDSAGQYPRGVDTYKRRLLVAGSLLQGRPQLVAPRLCRCVLRERDALDAVAEKAAKKMRLVPVPRWISVDVKLPSTNKDVLVWRSDLRVMHIALIDEYGYWFATGGTCVEPLHFKPDYWCSLPEGPTE